MLQQKWEWGFAVRHCVIPMRALPQIRINAENCLLDHNSVAPLIEHVGVRDVAATISYAIELTATSSNAYPRTKILWRIAPLQGASVDILWEDRFDVENAWYKDKFSEAYAPWLESPRKLDRAMHQATPLDYLVADEEEMGFHLVDLPRLPPEENALGE